MERDTAFNPNRLTMPELLAPAGDWSSLVAAVQNGADAVYLGAQAFSARQDAANFSRAEIAEAVSYSHIRGVRIYVTLNTLVSDEELPSALDLAGYLKESGVDGLIVQDLGLAASLRLNHPSIPLHGSTQMTVHNTEGVQFLADLGFTRIVVARELTLEEIRAIADQTCLKIEAFGHGALCFSYSGKCLLSSMIGGRSGNRGRCAQPCRMEYTLVNHEGKSFEQAASLGSYILSPKDMLTLDRLDELVQSGIDSIKIEGRMKRPEYVATVVKAYRKALDHLATGAPLGQADLDQDRIEVEQMFNRGFTPGYLFGNPGRDLMSYTRGSNRGRFLGIVTKVSSELTFIELESDLAAGDGYEVWLKDNGRVGGEIRTVFVKGVDRNLVPADRGEAGQVVGINIDGPVSVGDRVYKNKEISLLKQAGTTFKSEHETLQIPLSLRVTARLGQPVEITYCDSSHLCGHSRTEYKVEQARKYPISEEVLLEQLGRLGNTPFSISSYHFDLDANIMIPKSELNEARRRAMANLMHLRESFYSPVRLSEESRSSGLLQEYAHCLSILDSVEDHHHVSVVVDSLPALEAALDAGAGLIYLADTQFSRRESSFSTLSQIQDGVEKCLQQGSAGVFLLPPIAKELEMRHYRRLVQELGSADVPIPVSVGDLGMLEVTRESAAAFMAEAFLNPFNSRTTNLLSCLGASQVALSPELTLDQIRKVASDSKVPLELLVHGPQVVMISEHCPPGSIIGGAAAGVKCSRPCKQNPLFGLKDRLGKLFPLRVDAHCRMHLFNSVDVCLIEHLWQIRQAGIYRIRIEGRLYEPAHLHNVVSRYAEGWCRTYNSEVFERELAQDLAEFRRELEPAHGITKGHLFRGVL